MASLKAHEALVADLRRSIADLEARAAEQRERLAEAEATLEAERNRPPTVGDFARSTLTHFYGRITKVTPRPDGRPWVEINPYLTPNLPGRSTLDLFDAWELIDDPAATDAGAESTGVEIVTRLTETLAMFRPPQPELLQAPLGSIQAPLGSLQAPQGIPSPQGLPPAQGSSHPHVLRAPQEWPSPQALPSPQHDENSGAEAAHGPG
jgi:hypothetical protein